jgi:SAM-dependent methyltransferase
MASEEATRIIDLYQRKASEWIEGRARTRLFEKPWLDRFLALLPPAAPILDLGCGSAEPMAVYLIGLGHPVTGVDSSPAMIDVCRKRLPTQEWIVADMRKLALQRKFSGILAWDSFFHLCHDDQRNMFPVFRAHAAPRAALMFTSGPAHGEAIGRLQASRFIMRALMRPNIDHCSTGTDFTWCRMSSRTPTAVATPSGSRSSCETQGANAAGDAGR